MLWLWSSSIFTFTPALVRSCIAVEDRIHVGTHEVADDPELHVSAADDLEKGLKGASQRAGVGPGVEQLDLLVRADRLDGRARGPERVGESGAIDRSGSRVQSSQSSRTDAGAARPATCRIRLGAEAMAIS